MAVKLHCDFVSVEMRRQAENDHFLIQMYTSVGSRNSFLA